MRRALVMALVAVTLLAPDAPTDAVKKELDRFQGEWVLVSSARDGMKTPESEVKLFRLMVKGTDYTILRDGKTVGRGQLKVDPSKTPRTIETVSTEGADKDQKMLGIYEWNGKEQRVCFARPGKPRPTEFTAKAGSGNLLAVWKPAK